MPNAHASTGSPYAYLGFNGNRGGSSRLILGIENKIRESRHNSKLGKSHSEPKSLNIKQLDDNRPKPRKTQSTGNINSEQELTITMPETLYRITRHTKLLDATVDQTHVISPQLGVNNILLVARMEPLNKCRFSKAMVNNIEYYLAQELNKALAALDSQSIKKDAHSYHSLTGLNQENIALVTKEIQKAMLKVHKEALKTYKQRFRSKGSYSTYVEGVSLTAAVAHNNQLYTVQVGRTDQVAVIATHKDKLLNAPSKRGNNWKRLGRRNGENPEVYVANVPLDSDQPITISIVDLTSIKLSTAIDLTKQYEEKSETKVAAKKLLELDPYAIIVRAQANTVDRKYSVKKETFWSRLKAWWNNRRNHSTSSVKYIHNLS